MPFTGKLGTANSRLGNIELGYGYVPQTYTASAASSGTFTGAASRAYSVTATSAATFSGAASEHAKHVVTTSDSATFSASAGELLLTPSVWQVSARDAFSVFGEQALPVVGGNLLDIVTPERAILFNDSYQYYPYTGNSNTYAPSSACPPHGFACFSQSPSGQLVLLFQCAQVFFDSFLPAEYDGGDLVVTVAWQLSGGEGQGTYGYRLTGGTMYGWLAPLYSGEPQSSAVQPPERSGAWAASTVLGAVSTWNDPPGSTWNPTGMGSYWSSPVYTDLVFTGIRPANIQPGIPVVLAIGCPIVGNTQSVQSQYPPINVCMAFFSAFIRNR